MKKILELLAGSKAGELYLRIVNLGSGYRTYLAGLAMVLRGTVELIDAAQGTTLGHVLDLLRHPAMDQINEGLALMALRAGMKSLNGGTNGANNPPQ